MPWIYVRKLFLLLLAMVLSPMQASAAQLEHKSHLPHFSKLQPFTVANSATNSPVDISELTEESTQSPVSEGMPAKIHSLFLTLSVGHRTYVRISTTNMLISLAI